MLNVHLKGGCNFLVTLSTFNSKTKLRAVFEKIRLFTGVLSIGRSIAWTSQTEQKKNLESSATNEHMNLWTKSLSEGYFICCKMASRRRADHSVLKRSIETNTTGMKQALLAMKTGSPEVCEQCQYHEFRVKFFSWKQRVIKNPKQY